MTSSRIPISSQLGTHSELDRVVGRHLSKPWRQPLRAHSVAAFNRLANTLDIQQPLIFDSGCGTAGSTRQLALGCPDFIVLGIDKSEQRLARAPALPKNAHLVRAELADFWRLARQAGVRPHKHYLLYPNPWPKSAHLKRRWHGHPVFPDLVRLGGEFELRTNFLLYAEEFLQALAILGVQAQLSQLETQGLSPISAFEQKYLNSGHALYQLLASFG